VAKLRDNEAQLFLDKNFGAVATLREDGGPLLTPVWADYDGENVVFNTRCLRSTAAFRATRGTSPLSGA
jgi:hypothetical protein